MCKRCCQFHRGQAKDLVPGCVLVLRNKWAGRGRGSDSGGQRKGKSSSGSLVVTAVAAIIAAAVVVVIVKATKQVSGSGLGWPREKHPSSAPSPSPPSQQWRAMHTNPVTPMSARPNVSPRLDSLDGWLPWLPFSASPGPDTLTVIACRSRRHPIPMLFSGPEILPNRPHPLSLSMLSIFHCPIFASPGMCTFDRITRLVSTRPPLDMFWQLRR